MKTRLTAEDLEAAVIGGAILGGGGGGFIERGRATAQLALQAGSPELWSVDEFDDDELVATVALVGAPAAPNPLVQPVHSMRALELLRQQLYGRRLAAIHTNENGAETTINGWLHAAMTGLPVIDLACNGRAHPTSVMGAMGLHLVPEYRSVQAWAGGHPETYVEGVATGRLDATSGVVRRASVEAGGWVSVARNPVEIGYAAEHGAPGAITFAIDLGRRFLTGGIDAVAAALGGAIVASGTVVAFDCEQREGLDIGRVALDDADATELRFVNEYMTADLGGNRVGTFPDLIATFDGSGAPLPSAKVTVGQQVSVLFAPASGLPLAATMWMPDLYAPLEDLLGFEFAPRAEVAGTRA